MTTHRGSKPPDQEQQRKKEKHRRRQLDRAGAGPTLKQVMRAGRARPRAAAHEAHEKPPSGRPAVSSLGLELEGQESRVGTVDLPKPSPLGLELEAWEAAWARTRICGRSTSWSKKT